MYDDEDEDYYEYIGNMIDTWQEEDTEMEDDYEDYADNFND